MNHSIPRIRCRLRYALLAVCITMFPAVSIAQSEVFNFEQGVDTYNGFDDTTLFSEFENSGGGTPGIYSGTIQQIDFNGNRQHRRALIRVDLSSIPTNWIVDSVSLTLTVQRSGGNFGDVDYSLHRVSQSWGEGTVVGLSEGGFGNVAEPGDATWLSRFHDADLWTAPGGDFAVDSSATAPAGIADTTVTWTSAKMADDVQQWFDSPASNHGWIIISDEEGTRQRVKRFYSSESADFRPVLQVVAHSAPASLPAQSPLALVTLLAALLGLGILIIRRIASVK